MDNSLREHILFLEQQLLKDDVRKNEQELDIILADDYLEFGKSGRTYNKRQEIDGLINSVRTLGQTSLMDVNIKLLAENVVLLTYRLLVEKEMKYSLRSSIWLMNEDRWQLVFHQGTPSIIQ